MKALHGSGYFKLLDDAAFFAAQAKDDEHFIFTTSFNTFIVRPVSPGTALVARGKVISNGRNLKVSTHFWYLSAFTLTHQILILSLFLFASINHFFLYQIVTSPIASVFINN